MIVDYHSGAGFSQPVFPVLHTVNGKKLKKKNLTMKTTPKWTDVWHAPFWYDDCGYIFDKDSVMTFTVDDLTYDNEKWFKTFCDDMVKVLNGEQPSQKYPGLTVKYGCDLHQYEPILGSFRGWGHLTGTGGLNLSEEEVAAVQDELIKYVIDKLS